MEKYEIKLENGVNLKILDDNLICLYGNEDSSNYFIKIDNLLMEISKKKYNDEWFIEKSILSYKAQKEKTYTFYKNDILENEIEKYSWCQRPCDSNMSLRNFDKNANVCGYMSESLAEEHGLEQIDLNTFIFKLVQPIFKENLNLQEENKKKDKMIDLMAIAIDNYDSQLVINSFKDKEDVKRIIKKKVSDGDE